MRLFLIKVGKAWDILKKEGLVTGVKRISLVGYAFLKMLKKAKPGDILFVAGGAMGDSTFYRVHNQAEELRSHGFRCSTVAQDNPWIGGYGDKFKVFIFHRVLYDKRIAQLVENIKKTRGDIIFETDDLTFDPKYLKRMDFYGQMNNLHKMLYEKGLGIEFLKDAYVKTCVCTTSYLAEEIRKYGKTVYISSNKISNHELQVVGDILQKNVKAHDGFTRVGYFSGTSTHNKDFATVTEALLKVLKKYPKTKLLLAGPLEVESKLNEFRSRIEQVPRVSRDRYYENIYKADINLAPLEINNPFCEAKSEIKFIETGILKVPTVAVRNQTFSGAISDGVTGFLADNTAEWVEKIGRLVEDENLRREMGERAREKILRDYTNKNSHNEEYYNYLKSQL